MSVVFTPEILPWPGLVIPSISMLTVLIFDAGIGEIDGDIDVVDVYGGLRNGHIFECVVIRE